MPKLYMLVGVPGSGKSTWIKDQVWALGLSVVSTDPWVEDHAKREGKTYSEVFEEYMPIAVRLMTNHALTAQANHNDIIWDRPAPLGPAVLESFACCRNIRPLLWYFERPSQKNWHDDWPAVRAKQSHLR